MPCTVTANCRGIAHKGSLGQSIAFPDVCLTPAPPAPSPVPIPYPNIGMSLHTIMGPVSARIDGMMPMVQGSKYMMTTGDEAGINLGVMSAMIKGPAEFMMYSFDVKLSGKAVCRMGDPMFHNKKNIMG